MKRFIAMIIISLSLVGIATFEEIYIHNFIQNFSAKSQIVSNLVKENQENLNTQELKENFENLKNLWSNSKTVICYFTNYDKIRTTDESIVKLEDAIKENDFSLANENIAVLKNYSQFFHYTMGFNINNLF